MWKAARTFGLAVVLMGMPLLPRHAVGGERSLRIYNLDFSTYLGGSSGEYVRGMTADAQGNLYGVGGTGSRDFPTTDGAYQKAYTGGRSAAFVARFKPSGELAWSTFVGAGGDSVLFSVKVDREGFVYVSGRTGPGFPTTPGAFQPEFKNRGDQNGFVAKLEPDGSGLVWASYVSIGQYVRDMDLDAQGNIYLTLPAHATGSTFTLPESWFAKAYQKTPHIHPGGGAMGDCGIIKVPNDGKQVHWATYVGGSKGNFQPASVAVGADGCPVLFLGTLSDDMPTTDGAFSRTIKSLPAAWLGKLSADGSSLIFGTYTTGAGVGAGTPLPRTHNVALDAQGNIFICSCMPPNASVTPDAFQPKFGGGPEDFWIAKFSPAGKLLAATYLGGSGDEINGPDQIVVDASGNVMIVGSSSSTDYPVTDGAFQPRNGGAGGKYPFDGVVTLLSNDLSTLLYSSYIGGSGDEMARVCCVGANGTLYVGGVTTGKDFPTKNAFQAAYAGDPGFGSVPNGGRCPVGWGNGDCWVARFSPLSGAASRRGE